MTSSVSPTLIKEGDYVLISGGGSKRILQIKKGYRARLGNSGSAELCTLVGMRFGEVVRLDHTGKRFMPVNEYPDLDLSNVGEEVDTSRDNRDLVDTNLSQQLTNSDVAAIRQEGGVEALLDQLVENSATFQTKTTYAQEKYLRRKRKKYGVLFKVEAVTVDQMAEVHVPTIQPPSEERGEEVKAVRLRADTVALILHHSEVHASSRVLMFERTNGVLPAYFLTRLGPEGRIFQVLEKNGQPNTLHTKVLQIDNVKQRWKAIPNNEPFLLGVETEKKPEDASPVPAESSENNGRRNVVGSSGVTQWMKGLDAHHMLRENPADSLVIVDDTTAAARLQELFPFLACGGFLVVHTPYLEDLSPIFAALRRECVNIRVSETWYRYHQVLPQRTHPTVNMSTASGYLLTAIKVNPQGCPSGFSSEEAYVGEKRPRES